MPRGLLLAMQFLTRLPVPRLAESSTDETARALAGTSGWFPIVGLVIGGVLAAALVLGMQIDPWLGALAGLLAWIWITGGLHLDGLADVADALGAAHRDRARFLEVLRDPHIGTFGVLAIVSVCAAKLILLAIIARGTTNAWLALPLLAAWSRLGALAWSRWLPPLAPGSGARLGANVSLPWVVAWTVALLIASALLAAPLLLAPLAIIAWGIYLRRRVGGMTGDCLGAGIEVTETVMLALLAIGPAMRPFTPWA